MTIEALSEKRQTILATAREQAENPAGDMATVKSLIAEAQGIADRIEALKSIGQSAPVAAPAVAQIEEPWKSGSVARNPFTGTRDEANFKAYAFGQWARSLTGNRKSTEWVKNNLKTQVEGTTTAGGFTVPDPLSSDLIYLREQYGIARQNCRIYPMTSDILNVPNATVSTIVRYPGENATITASDMEFAQVQLVAKKMAILTQVSKELAEDSIIDFGATLARDMAWAMAQEEDKVVFNNAVYAAAGINGILYGVYSQDATKANIANVVTFTTVQTPTFSPALNDLAKMVGKMPTYATNPKWYLHREVFFNAVVPKLQALSGNAIGDIQNAFSQAPTLYGYPVVFVQNMAKTLAANTAYILFGDLSVGTVFGDRRGVTVEVSDQRYFETDNLAYKATQRFAFNAFDLGNINAAVGSQVPGSLIVGASVGT